MSIDFSSCWDITPVSGTTPGSDVHNKGVFATEEALVSAYSTAQPGDYAIVSSTDTVWVWDEDTTAWVDTYNKGQVLSVNGKTGEVVLSLEDLGITDPVFTVEGE